MRRCFQTNYKVIFMHMIYNCLNYITRNVKGINICASTRTCTKRQYRTFKDLTKIITTIKMAI